MSAETALWGDLFHELSQFTLGRINVATPARVLGYASATQTCEVQPFLSLRVREPDGDDVIYKASPPVFNVPVLWPASAVGSWVPGLAVGDHVLLIMSDRSVDEWKRAANPPIRQVDVRRCQLTDAFAYPGGQPPSVPLSAAQYRDGATVLWSAGDLLLGASTAIDPVVTESRLAAWWGTVQAAFVAHTHPDPTSGATGPAVGTLPAVSGVGSPTVKVS